MSNILAKICEQKLRHIQWCKQKRPFKTIELAAEKSSPPRGFIKALKRASRSSYGLIAEIKKASPSKGLIRQDFDPKKLAVEYTNGGATCISVLTDKPFFQGSDDYLTAARSSTHLPVLRKDFMLDTYQIIEARALGADCVLLILAALEDQMAADLEAQAIQMGMDVLIEVHNVTELERALKLQSPMIGINNRNLKTMNTDLTVTERLVASVPPGRFLISESGINKPKDLARMASYGVRCFLIGEALMRQENVEAATKSLISEPVPTKHSGQVQ